MVADLLAAPAADRGAVPRDRDLLPVVARGDRHARAALDRLRPLLALLVEREVVPDVAAIVVEREIHVAVVVLGQLRRAHRDQTMLAGRQRSERLEPGERG